MNNNKKIIETLRKADKASVEKLMTDEAKKNEIFAKAKLRANISQSEYTYSVRGAEDNRRKINMTRFINIAATVALMTGLVGGGAYMNNKLPKTPEPETYPETETQVAVTVPETVTAVNTEVQVTKPETEEHDKSTVTEVVYVTAEGTSAVEDTEVTTVQQVTEEQNKVSVTTEELTEKISKEELIEKAKDNNCVNYFDKFSADYTVLINEGGEFYSEPSTVTGKFYLDEVGGSASRTSEQYVNGKCISKTLIAIKDNLYYEAREEWAETDYSNGGFIFLETPKKNCWVKDNNSDKVFLLPGGRELDVYNPENWEITGERIENGRNIVLVSGVQKGDNNYEGVYRERTYTAEADAATGVILSYEERDREGNITFSYKTTNYRFDDDAVEFKSAADIINEIKNSGFTMYGSDGNIIE